MDLYGFIASKVIEIKGECTIGMKVGDEFDLSLYQCGELCGSKMHRLRGMRHKLPNRCHLNRRPNLENPISRPNCRTAVSRVRVDFSAQHGVCRLFP